MPPEAIAVIAWILWYLALEPVGSRAGFKKDSNQNMVISKVDERDPFPLQAYQFSWRNQRIFPVIHKQPANRDWRLLRPEASLPCSKKQPVTCLNG